MRRSAGGIEPPTFQSEVAANSLPAKWRRGRKSNAGCVESNHSTCRALPEVTASSLPSKGSEEKVVNGMNSAIEPLPVRAGFEPASLVLRRARLPKEPCTHCLRNGMEENHRTPDALTGVEPVSSCDAVPLNVSAGVSACSLPPKRFPGETQAKRAAASTEASFSAK